MPISLKEAYEIMGIKEKVDFLQGPWLEYYFEQAVQKLLNSFSQEKDLNALIQGKEMLIEARNLVQIDMMEKRKKRFIYKENILNNVSAERKEEIIPRKKTIRFSEGTNDNKKTRDSNLASIKKTVEKKNYRKEIINTPIQPKALTEREQMILESINRIIRAALRKYLKENKQLNAIYKKITDLKNQCEFYKQKQRDKSTLTANKTLIEIKISHLYELTAILNRIESPSKYLVKHHPSEYDLASQNYIHKSANILQEFEARFNEARPDIEKNNDSAGIAFIKAVISILIECFTATQSLFKVAGQEFSQKIEDTLQQESKLSGKM